MSSLLSVKPSGPLVLDGSLRQIDGGRRANSTFRPDIEGLRAIAVLSVVGFHYGVKGLSGGFVGVDIFFVISGYLISSLLSAEITKSGTIDLVSFYGRRARRLLPASLLVCSASLICGAIIISPLEQLPVADAAIAASAYVSNFFFVYQNFGYFSPDSAFSPFLHTWSLAVEEQFYFVWPALILFLNRSKNFPKTLFAALVCGTVLSFVLCVWLTSIRQPLGFYTLPARAWEFGFGGVLSSLKAAELMKRAPFSPLIGWAGMVALGMACLINYDLSRFPGPDALLAVVATGCVLISGASGHPRGPALLLATKPFEIIGKLSYSIYLWHWPILVYALILYPKLPATGRLGCGLLTLVCAGVSYGLLEGPVRQSRWLKSKRTRSLGLAGILTVVGISLGLGAGAVARTLAKSPMQARIDRETSEAPLASGSGQKCLVGFTKSDVVSCTFGSAASQQTVVLLGDSHADEWSNAMGEISRRRGWRVITYLKSSCSVAEIPVYNIRLLRFSPECTQWRSNAIKAILDLHPAAVVIAEFSSGYVAGTLTDLGDHAVSLDAWSEGLRRSVRAFSDAGIRVLLIRDSPTPHRNIRTCLARADWNNQPLSTCDVRRLAAVDDRITVAERAVAGSIPGTGFVDLSSAICGADVCPAIQKGVVVYRDANHLTAPYAAGLADALDTALVPMVSAAKHIPVVATP